MINAWRDYQRAPWEFARRATEVTPDDDEDFAEIPRALQVLSAGTVVVLPVDNADGDVIAYDALGVGQNIPIQARRVLATGTTARVGALY